MAVSYKVETYTYYKLSTPTPRNLPMEMKTLVLAKSES